MKMIAGAFGHQMGGMFGFGKEKDTDTNNVKICDMGEEQLENVKVHNLGEGRNLVLVINFQFEENIISTVCLEKIVKKIVKFKRYKKEVRTIY